MAFAKNPEFAKAMNFAKNPEFAKGSRGYIYRD
jgi:hypothetical protein